MMNRQCFSPLVTSAHVNTQMSVEDNALKKNDVPIGCNRNNN